MKQAPATDGCEVGNESLTESLAQSRIYTHTHPHARVLRSPYSIGWWDEAREESRMGCVAHGGLRAHLPDDPHDPRLCLFKMILYLRLLEPRLLDEIACFGKLLRCVRSDGRSEGLNELRTATTAVPEAAGE